MSKLTIPPHFIDAARIFLGELEGHEQAAAVALKTLVDTGAIEEKLAKELAERFHLIRGGAGFLGLDELKQLAEKNEKFFRNPQNYLDRESTSATLADAQRILREVIRSLCESLQ